MAAHGQQLLSKIVDTGDVLALTRLGIKRTDYATEGEQRAHDFVVKYAADNGGVAPSLSTFVAEFPDEVCAYIPGVTDSFDYLARELKDAAGKRATAKLLSDPNMQRDFDTKTTEEFVASLTKQLERIKLETRTNVLRFTDIAGDAGEYLVEYRARKAGTSFKIWRSKFATINEQIGGYFSGNMYAWYGRSGRGKSVIVMEDAVLEAAFQGATVLPWILEMNKYEWMARAYSSISARISGTVERIDGVDYTVGFDNRAMLMGKLDEGYERGLEQFCAVINDIIPGRILLRATDSEGFTERTVAQLEADIIETEADIVVVDPVYLMDFEANTSRVAGGDVAETSKKLRRLAGRLKVVMHIVTQADEDEKEKGEDGVREIRLPKRADVKKTKAILEDATNLFGVDTLNNEGRGVIGIGKGRNGGEDATIELVYLPNWGLVMETDKAAEAEQFVSGF
ncbi:DnaB-like helicase C-terminal domain-containing protein [Paenibacillus sp. FSL K6-3166]|uniref:DnaB-like helicase C-terminal domain-containing protein n=1 Tax=unclassified Paenibacillus TaxID=185978 RepID=UPI000BA0CEFB|nr:DnaB-like helicase C-terminal domain-containing protein [Paenibacillus sp. VTT E-133291]OZQ84676.1 DNA helicase [Paenibacillus sp. VTT E-133291]